MKIASVERPKLIYFLIPGDDTSITQSILSKLKPLQQELGIEDIRACRMQDGQAFLRLVSRHQIYFTSVRPGSRSWTNLIKQIFDRDITVEEHLMLKERHARDERHAPTIIAVKPVPEPLAPVEASPYVYQLGPKPDGPPLPALRLPPLPAVEQPVVMSKVNGRAMAMIQTEIRPVEPSPPPIVQSLPPVVQSLPPMILPGKGPLDKLFQSPPAAVVAQILKDYLTSRDFGKQEQAFREPHPGEAWADYYRERRTHLGSLIHDRSPWIIRAYLLPASFRADTQCDLPVVKELIQWHKGGRDWSGLWTLVPRQPILESSKYWIPEQPDPCASVLEVHRRIMRLEGACQDLADYIQKVTLDSYTLRLLAPNEARAAYHILLAGCGLHGDIWTPAPRDSPAVSKLEKFINDPTSPIAKAPSDLRDLSHTYPLLSELDWGLPLLAFYHRSHPLRPDSAEPFLAALKEFVGRRRHVYAEALKPRLLYGARLTEYVQSVYLVAKAFQKINVSDIAFPETSRLCLIHPRGYMMGPDKQPSQAGHTLFAPGDAPPIPFPRSCLAVQPMPAQELAELISNHRSEESRAVNELIHALGILSSPVVDARNRAIKLVDEALQADSHRESRTRFLQPTASMPAAVQNSKYLYGM